MSGNDLLKLPTYDPGNLLDALRDMLQLKNDAALGRTLQVAAPVISKIRSRTLPVGAMILIAMHEESGLSIRDLRRLMGDTREKFSDVAPFHLRERAAA
jgi:hypothetical protein